MVTYHEFVEIAYDERWNGGTDVENTEFLKLIGQTWRENRDSLRNMTKTRVREELGR